jgi:hypothetical protein
MSFDVKFMRQDGKPLGTVESIQKAVLAVLPAIVFNRVAGGEERIAQFADRGALLPEALRDVFAQMPATIEGNYGREKDGLWLQFFLGSGGELRLLHVAVKGDTNAAEPLLNQLASSQGWVLSAFAARDEDDKKPL